MWEQMLKNGLAGLILVMLGAVGGTSLLAQAPPAPAQAQAPSGISPDVLEERIKGQQAVVLQRLDDIRASTDTYIATVAQIAKDTGEIRASVREQGFNIAALQGQIAALAKRVEVLEGHE